MPPMPSAPSYGFPVSYDPSVMSMPAQSHFAASPFAPMPPPIARPPSNPLQSSNFARDAGVPRGYPQAPQYPTSSGGGYTEYTPAEPTWQQQSAPVPQHAQPQPHPPQQPPQPQAKLASAFSFDDGASGRNRRTRTPSNNANAAYSGDSLDAMAAHRERPMDDKSLHPSSASGGGNNSSGSNHKHRPSLDDHMAFVRSPKAPSATTSAPTATSTSISSSKAAYMSIPVIPPFRGRSSAANTPPPQATAAMKEDGTFGKSPRQPQPVPVKTVPSLFG